MNPRAEFLEHAIHLHQGAPKSVRGVGVVGCMHVIVAERDRARDFTGKLGYLHLDPEIGERPHDGGVKIADRLRHQPDASALPAARLDVEGVIDEIKSDLEVLALDKG